MRACLLSALSVVGGLASQTIYKMRKLTCGGHIGNAQLHDWLLSGALAVTVCGSPALIIWAVRCNLLVEVPTIKEETDLATCFVDVHPDSYVGESSYRVLISTHAWHCGLPRTFGHRYTQPLPGGGWERTLLHASCSERRLQEEDCLSLKASS